MNKDDLKELQLNLTEDAGILGKEEYLNTAVLIPLVNINDEYHFLFEKRSEKIRQGGEICFPGGEFDDSTDPDLRSTAVRETVEELGIDSKNVEVAGDLGILVGPMGITIDIFVGELRISDLKELNIDKNEVEKVFTVPVSYFSDNKPDIYYVRLESHPHYFDEEGKKVVLLPVEELKLPSRYANPWGLQERKVFVYKTAGEIIWGLTANIIYEFIKKLKQI